MTLCVVSMLLSAACESAPDSGSDKVVLSLATDFKSPALMDMVNDFNASCDRYEINVIVYGGKDRGLDVLRTELIAGKAPDIFAFNTDVLTDVIDGWFFEDLTPYIKEDDDLTGEAIVQPLLNALMDDGALYRLPYQFYIRAFLGSAEAFDGATTSLSELLAAVKQMGDGWHPLPLWQTRYDTLAMFLYVAGESFIDRDTLECDFNVEDFKALLELCAMQPEPPDENSDPSLGKPDVGTPDDGKSLLRYEVVQSVEATSALEEQFGEYCFVNIGGQLGVLMHDLRFSINQDCKYKDAAWAFVRGCLSAEEQAKAIAIPALRSELTKRIETALAAEASTTPGFTVALSQNEADRLQALIESLTPQPEYYLDLYRIVSDCAREYFAGAKTAEECAAQVDSKVQLLLYEQA